MSLLQRVSYAKDGHDQATLASTEVGLGVFGFDVRPFVLFVAGAEAVEASCSDLDLQAALFLGFTRITYMVSISEYFVSMYKV